MIYKTWDHLQFYQSSSPRLSSFVFKEQNKETAYFFYTVTPVKSNQSLLFFLPIFINQQNLCHSHL